MNQSELDEILESHNRWIRGEKDGRRAGLWGVDLRGADLSGSVYAALASLRPEQFPGTE